MESMTTPLVSNFGERFSPTNEELINHFLKQKLLGNDQLVSRIPLLDFYMFDPWDLPWTNSNKLEGYFFSPLHARYSCTNNMRINRKTSTGSWQKKGKDYKITSLDNEELIGIKKIFVHSCMKDEIKYVMHEYSLPNQSDLVVCKVIKKKPSKKSEGSSNKVKRREEEAELPLRYKDNNTLEYDVMKKKMPESKSEEPRKKVRRTEEKAEIPDITDNTTPVSDEDSDFVKWITSDKSDLSTHDNVIGIKDQQSEKSTCDQGGTSCLKTSASILDGADFTIPENQVDLEILPHTQSFISGYDDQPLTLTEQVHTNNGPAGTYMSVPEEDLFNWLDPFWD